MLVCSKCPLSPRQDGCERGCGPHWLDCLMAQGWSGVHPTQLRPHIAQGWSGVHPTQLKAGLGSTPHSSGLICGPPTVMCLLLHLHFWKFSDPDFEFALHFISIFYMLLLFTLCILVKWDEVWISGSMNFKWFDNVNWSYTVKGWELLNCLPDEDGTTWAYSGSAGSGTFLTHGEHCGPPLRWQRFRSWGQSPVSGGRGYSILWVSVGNTHEGVALTCGWGAGRVAASPSPRPCTAGAPRKGLPSS